MVTVTLLDLLPTVFRKALHNRRLIDICLNHSFQVLHILFVP
jgi:hypothetical protein